MQNSWRHPSLVRLGTSALERFILNLAQTTYLRVYAWWVCIQCWCTLRFSDHRGVKPSSVRVKGSALLALLTWSKTLGLDKAVGSRPLVVDVCCFLSHPSWLLTGWTLLSTMALFARDFLLPSPSAALTSCLRTELSYDTVYALQGHLMLLIRDTNGQSLTSATPHFWTPHSSRNFFPFSTAAT